VALATILNVASPLSISGLATYGKVFGDTISGAGPLQYEFIWEPATGFFDLEGTAFRLNNARGHGFIGVKSNWVPSIHVGDPRTLITIPETQAYLPGAFPIDRVPFAQTIVYLPGAFQIAIV